MTLPKILMLASVSDTEALKCKRAESMVKNAIKKESIFKPNQLKNIRIFAQGSYANGTNISEKSDVDIAICYTESFFTDFTFAPNLNNYFLDHSLAFYTFDAFKEDVKKALESYFVSDLVKVGNKSFKIDGNTYRIKIDVVPCFELRLYFSNGYYLVGTRFISSKGEIITNFPYQHYHNGLEKNKETSYRFKKVVRSLKEINISSPDSLRISSFLIESLIWNVPTSYFTIGDSSKTLESVVRFLDKKLKCLDAVSEMLEINGIKNLFHEDQLWKPCDVQHFINHVKRFF